MADEFFFSKHSYEQHYNVNDDDDDYDYRNASLIFCGFFFVVFCEGKNALETGKRDVKKKK